MRRNIVKWLIMPMLLAVAACSSDGEQEVTSLAGGEINLTSSVAMTRAESTLQATQITASVKVGAFGLSGTTLLTNGNNNQYSADGSGNLTATNNMEWPASGGATIYAYAPYQSGWTYNTDNTFTVQNDQSTEANYLASDLLYGVPASNPVAKTTSAVPLTFTHKLAKVNITISKGVTAPALTNAKVYITNTMASTTFNPSTGAVGEATGAANPILVGTLTSETAVTISAVVVPQTVAANKRLILLTLADNSSLEAKVTANTTFEGGKEYTFTAYVESDTKLTLGTTSITNWGNPTDIGSADATEATE